MINNAKDKLVNQSGAGLPQVGDILSGWFQSLEFEKVVKSIENYEVKETRTLIITKGVRQPLSPQAIYLKPEGQRAWIWQTIHCLPNIVLKNDDIIIFDEIRYRVMARLNWQEYGYVEYHICEDYKNAAD
ncbi:MAG: hypothetical protein LBT79_07915 [Elusimicrobiota bacterium]|jgi:hypothetical protein|nr:hypothetical protein [Elusimicrobiota bacterium]